MYLMTSSIPIMITIIIMRENSKEVCNGVPVLNIYRKYYGMKVSAFLFATFYAAMAGAALAVEIIFDALGLVPASRSAKIVEAAIAFNYTTVLNIIFLILALLLLIRFFRTGGVEMLRMMDGPDGHHHDHGRPRP